MPSLVMKRVEHYYITLVDSGVTPWVERTLRFLKGVRHHCVPRNIPPDQCTPSLYSMVQNIRVHTWVPKV